MTEYTAQGGPGMVAFATKVPGQILPIEVSDEKNYMVHRGGLPVRSSGREPRDRLPAEVQRRSLRRRRVHPAEGLGQRPGVDRAGRRDRRLRPRARARSSRSTRATSGCSKRGWRSSWSGSRGSRTSCSAPTRCSWPSSPVRARSWLQTMPLPNLAAALVAVPGDRFGRRRQLRQPFQPRQHQPRRRRLRRRRGDGSVRSVTERHR